MLQESDGESTKWASFQIPSTYDENKMIELDEQFADSDGGEEDNKLLLRHKRTTAQRDSDAESPSKQKKQPVDEEMGAGYADSNDEIQEDDIIMTKESKVLTA
eukprot:CAMPEP_0170472384 /NCGR_PEP_ID=MMETSP0123-20130129/14436_1 /TAXON_ID=182087 /ORGANISM="Favella ehrenbergii, Strain Fehren 1" /LENGTH=102 /DNA_ID=CAMNT_0010740643 /DNA_START=349 /DNA_END=657 /DNA_ORIENTATION=-